jgi:hypothetical protein
MVMTKLLGPRPQVTLSHRQDFSSIKFWKILLQHVWSRKVFTLLSTKKNVNSIFKAGEDGLKYISILFLGCTKATTLSMIVKISIYPGIIAILMVKIH